MKIQPTQQTFQAKLLTDRIIHNGAQSVTKYKNIKLDNGKQLTIVDTFINGYKQSSLQYLTSNTGEWIKSRLKMISNNKIFRILESEAKKLQSKN